jgi:hypothetical protein
MEFEAGEQWMTPEMYEAYGFTKDNLPSDLHMSRVHDAEGRKQGFYAERRFSRSIVAICDFSQAEVTVKLVPIDLDLNRERVSERGLPALASPEEAQAIAKDMTDLSVWYGTRYELGADGLIVVRPGTSR